MCHFFSYNGLDGLDVENDDFCEYRTKHYWKLDHVHHHTQILFVAIESNLKKIENAVNQSFLQKVTSM